MKLFSRKHYFLPCFLLTAYYLLLTFSFVQAEDYTNTNFILRAPVITIEGGRSSTANFQYISSSGQTDTGENSNSNFIHRAGFLYFAEPSPAPSPSPSPGGGGTSGGKISLLPQVNFSGQADEGTKVILLQDARIATTFLVGSDKTFFIPLTRLSPGRYIFALYAENAAGARSSLRTFPVRVFPESFINIAGITFEFLRPEKLEEAVCSDFSGDGSIDLVDFSMLLFWFEREDVPAAIDCNGDGKADLIDFSIMAYYWTG